MFHKLLKRFSGRHNKKYIKRCAATVEQINKLEKSYQLLSNIELKQKTAAFMQRFKDGESIDSLLPEAFATVKNAARRLCGSKITVCGHKLTWEMIHYDVQLIGGIALHENKITEMATGEGKTLVATCPLYLNALTGQNCQLVTVNDYLAKRDSEWMGHLFNFLGLTVGCLQNNMDPDTRKRMYACNITYGTAAEFGFDYLRDNGMATRTQDQVQRDHYFCIIDEVDSVLVDEARTPLIISGPMIQSRPLPFDNIKPGIQKLVTKQQELCNKLLAQAQEELKDADASHTTALENLFLAKQGMPKNKRFLKLLENNEVRRAFEKFDLEMSSDFNKDYRYNLKERLYFAIDESQNQADLTEKGRQFLNPNNPDAYVLLDLPGEFVEIEKSDLSPEEKKNAKLAAEQKFQTTSEMIHCTSQLLRAYTIYEKDQHYVVQEGKVQIVDANTGRVMHGRRWSDGLHQAIEAKEGVTIERETKTYATITIQNYFRMYEKLAGMTGTAETEAAEFNEIYNLQVIVIPTHKDCQRVDLNDVVYKTRREKYNAVVEEIRELHRSGQPVLVGTGSVESSELLSRMLKREKITHSVLNAKFHKQEAEIISRAGQKGAVTIATNMAGRGTDIKLGEGVAEKGGLFVIGTERHESRRIDRQLRGRCARQGDPGCSKFFVSLEDDLLRLFANTGVVGKVLENSVSSGNALEHPLLNWAIENAQKKVEQQNFATRKKLLQYDDVLNNQRAVIYDYRNDALTSPEPATIIQEMINEELSARFSNLKSSDNNESLESLIKWIISYFPITLTSKELEGLETRQQVQHVFDKIKEAYKIKEETENKDALEQLERFIVMSTIDRRWQDHLTEMEELRNSVSLRSYGQKDPVNEYKKEAFLYFEQLMDMIQREISCAVFRTGTSTESLQKMLEKLSSVKVKVSGGG